LTLFVYLFQAFLQFFVRLSWARASPKQNDLLLFSWIFIFYFCVFRFIWKFSCTFMWFLFILIWNFLNFPSKRSFCFEAMRKNSQRERLSISRRVPCTQSKYLLSFELQAKGRQFGTPIVSALYPKMSSNVCLFVCLCVCLFICCLFVA